MRRWGGSTLSSTGTRRASLSLSLSSSIPRSSSGHRTLLSVPALIIHALTNPPPTRQGLSPSTRREGSTTLVLTRRSLGGAWTIPRALALLNYAEALTSTRPTLGHHTNPFAILVDWLSSRLPSFSVEQT